MEYFLMTILNGWIIHGSLSVVCQFSVLTSGFYWSKRQWMAVASAGPYASLHPAPDRQPHQHPTTQCFYRPDALSAAQPTMSKHWRHRICSSCSTANLLENLPVKECWKDVKIWWSYRHEFVVFLFWWHSLDSSIENWKCCSVCVRRISMSTK